MMDRAMVRVCKEPRIVEHEDRWGMGQGTYQVLNVQGWLDADAWAAVQAYEGYLESDEGRMLARMEMEGLGLEPVEAPLMQDLIARAGGRLVWELDLCLLRDPSPRGHGWVRTFALFGERTLREWTPEHDAMVARLQAECDRMNGEKKA